MDFLSTIGIILIFVVIGSGIKLGNGSLSQFWNPPSLMITGGGTLITFFISNNWVVVRDFLKIFGKAFYCKIADPRDTIPKLVTFAEKARREGLLALEDNIEELDDNFLKKGIQLVVDGTDPELVKTIMQTELDSQKDRHKTAINSIMTMSMLAPAFGLTGTIIGLVLMLATLNDPSTLGPKMAVALITTFYGVVLANGVLIPIASKLGKRDEEENTLRNIMIEGMLSIQSGDNPRLVEEKLLAFLPPNLRQTREEAISGGSGE